MEDPPVAKVAAAPAASDSKAAAADSKGDASGSKKEKGGKATKAPPAPVPAGPPPAEKTAAELAKMSKEERTQYHMARRAAQTAGAAAGSQDAAAAGNATAPAQLTKAQRRAIQESQRKVKEDKTNAIKDGDELVEELKLQGLTAEQAKEVMAAMRSGEIADEEEEDDDDDEVDTLVGSVRKWMGEQEAGEVSSDQISDFNMKVRFQGHVETTPPDHLGAMLEVLLEQALSGCDISVPKIQPGAVAKAFNQVAERWVNILRGLYSKIPDVLEGVGVVIKSIVEGVAASGAPAQGQDTAVVGFLMAVREIDDLVEDEDLLVGCKGVEPRSHVLEKFIEFLEEALEEDDDEEGSDNE